MKEHRTSWPWLLLSLGLMVGLTVVWRHWGGASQPKADPARSLSVKDQGVPTSSKPRPAALEASLRTDPIQTELEAAPFLRKLAARLAAIESEPDALRQDRSLENLANNVATADLAAAVQFVQGQSSSEAGRSLGQRLLRRWAEQDPRKAAEWVGRSPMGSNRREAISTVATVWANQNLGDALEWARQLTTDQERHRGLLHIAYEAARNEPVEALRVATELPANEARDDLMVYAASEWATRAPAAAAEWASQITDRTLQERLLADIATAWGDSNPAAAATFAMKSIKPGRPQEDAVVGIVQRWVQQQPEQTAAWVAQFPEGILRDTLIENMIKLWADPHMEPSDNGSNSLEPGESLDTRLGANVSTITPLAPAMAAQWAEQIGNDALRNQEIERVGKAWMDTDAAAARAWIAQAPLPEKTKARLLASESRPSP